jgi:hypothetical protein
VSKVIYDDDYVWTLQPKYRKIAETELQETDGRRIQAVKQMREWIEKHPKIIHCRSGW